VRIALVSPMPPARSGIADYSAALCSAIQSFATIEPVTSAAGFDPKRFDKILYQIGNNGDHAFVYELALRYPGAVVLHEANLHHLLCDLTIRRDDWDAYVREVEFDGGAGALAYAQRVRRLEVGPDYDGVPMLKRLLHHTSTLIVHSRFVEAKAREAGYQGRVAVIPHGAWTAPADRTGYRAKLGAGDDPVIGSFGHLKPYKRLAESLRAFRHVLQKHPRAKMILGGEPHPSLPLESMVDALGLTASVRLLGRLSDDDFTGYIAASDIVLNLRYPTVGETSGSLQRAFGLARAALVSDVGAFAEYPDEICLKVPAGAGEEQLIAEYLKLLIARPDLREAMGERARNWAERECSWHRVARLYVEALQAEESRSPPDAPAAKDILAWVEPEPGAAAYAEQHMDRLVRTLAVTPPGSAGDAVLEMGAYMQITPALRHRLGYGRIRGCYYGPLGKKKIRTVQSDDGREFSCEIDYFDAERDRFPYADGEFATVLCCELLEHLPSDPMHMMSEINRILRPGGHAVITTPNITSVRAIAAILAGYHPGFFPAYLLPEAVAEGDSRHNREYAPREIHHLLENSGFEVTLMETGPFRQEPHPDHTWAERLLEHAGIDGSLRGDGIYAVGRKTGPVRERYPAWLYS
jgi:glycosyltransferase involved in cell wall biosynthesis